MLKSLRSLKEKLLSDHFWFLCYLKFSVEPSKNVEKKRANLTIRGGASTKLPKFQLRVSDNRVVENLRFYLPSRSISINFRISVEPCFGADLD